MTAVRVRSVAAGREHSLALTWEGRVYSWGKNHFGELSRGDPYSGDDYCMPWLALVEGLEGVHSIAVDGSGCSLAVAQSGEVFSWGMFVLEDRIAPRPTIVNGFAGVRVRQVFAELRATFAIGETRELFSWGRGMYGRLGHGDREDQPSPKRVEALRGVRVSSVAAGCQHALALTEDGLVYAWGENTERAALGNPHVERELLPKPVEALRGVRVGSVAACAVHSYAVADTGTVWAWGVHGEGHIPLGHGGQGSCAVPKPIESLPGIKMDAVVTAENFQTLALAADDGSVYA
jgi:alpha-tubulin suppressor-like RCC1 family protein